MALRRFASSSLAQLGLRAQAQTAWAPVSSAFSRAYANVVGDCKYAESHEWAKPDGDIAVIGVSDHAQEALGDVVYVELPEVGSTVEKGSTFGVVESVKAASDVYAPVSGEVVEINEDLKNETGKINADPYGAGWMIKVKMSNKSELDSLLDAAAYEKHSEH